MGTTVTIRVRTVLLSIAMAVALLAAFVIGTAQTETSAAAAASTASTGSTPSIVMTGTGQATGVPDQLSFELAISSTASDVSTALRSASATTRRVLAAVKGENVARKDVRTTGLSINPVYDYNGKGPAVITGYNVTESMSVLVRTLPDAGTTISAAVQAGGNAVQLHGVRLQISDENAILHAARADAYAQARDKAEQYAAAAGRDLGDVTSVREIQTGGTVAPAAFSASSDSLPTASIPIRRGSADLHVTVKVAWSFAQ